MNDQSNPLQKTTHVNYTVKYVKIPVTVKGKVIGKWYAQVQSPAFNFNSRESYQTFVKDWKLAMNQQAEQVRQLRKIYKGTLRNTGTYASERQTLRYAGQILQQIRSISKIEARRQYNEQKGSVQKSLQAA